MTITTRVEIRQNKATDVTHWRVYRLRWFIWWQFVDGGFADSIADAGIRARSVLRENGWSVET